MHFEPLHNEIKCVLSIKESNFNEKMGQNFHISLRSGPMGLTPQPPYGQPDCKGRAGSAISILGPDRKLLRKF